jgi:hypothetical protein
MTQYFEQDPKVCGNCYHFCQHYVHTCSRYAPLPVGHCICLRSKRRSETDTCPSWVPRKK